MALRHGVITEPFAYGRSKTEEALKAFWETDLPNNILAFVFRLKYRIGDSATAEQPWVYKTVQGSGERVRMEEPTVCQTPRDDR